MKLIECVPNFSEGRDLSVVTAIRDAIAAVSGVSILHVTADVSHNRSVITFVAPYETMADAAFAGIRAAQTQIDLTRHGGVHPRMGAADVVPFIPLDGATMEDCIALAHTVGQRVGQELQIPVYLYERAATREDHRNLATVRRGGFEAIRQDLESGADRAPDYGPHTIHPTAGAVAIGARPFLIAYNVYLGDASNLPVAKAVAKAVRESSGGLPSVKALGLEVDGQAQVSMNLVDIEQTSLPTAFNAVAREARARGVDVTWSEIIGLVPERAIFETANAHLQLRDSIADHVLEHRLLDLRTREQTLRGFLDAVGNDLPTPGGGSVAAYVGALAASLAKMVAGLTVVPVHSSSGMHTLPHTIPPTDAQVGMQAVLIQADALSAQLSALTDQDANAYAAVMEAYRMPKGTNVELSARDDSIKAALLHAARIPFQVAELCLRVSELTLIALEHGKRSAATDVGVAALMAEAACKAAAYNVRVNVQALDGPGTELTNALKGILHATVQNAAQVAAKMLPD